MNRKTTCINSISNKAKYKNKCFMIHEILKYEEKKIILMEKMGKQYSQTPLKSQTMFRKYCVGVGEERDLSLLRHLIQTFIFGA